MMKKLLVILLAAFITFPVFSQVKFGIKAGASTTNLKMEDLKTLTSGDTQYTIDAINNARYGFHGGLFLRLGLAGVYIQPELLFSTKTDAYSVKEVDSPESVKTMKLQFTQLELPVMLGAKLGPVRLNAGPAARLLINSPKDLVDDPDFKSMYNKLTFGYQAGLGVDLIKRITIDLRYEGSLQKYQTRIENATGERFKLDDRPNAFLLSIGYMF
jgi:opacity protein-like surface antigen